MCLSYLPRIAKNCKELQRIEIKVYKETQQAAQDAKAWCGSRFG
jgi:hypothetical protein